MPASPRVSSRYATSTPRAVQDATADDIPYSTSSGCATTHSTRRKASSGNGGIKSVAMPESVAAAPADPGSAAPSARPADRVEHGDRVEVVPPVHDLAIAEREHGDVPVGVAVPGAHDVAFGGVLEHHDPLGCIVVNSQVKAAVKNDHGAVGAV